MGSGNAVSERVTGQPIASGGKKSFKHRTGKRQGDMHPEKGALHGPR